MIAQIVRHDGMFDGGWFFPLGGLIALLFTIGFWVLVIAVLVALVRRRSDGGPKSSALSVLEERYARGEIDQQEFMERRRVLGDESR